MFNATILGRLGADPELRTTTGGTEVCSFNVASDHGYGDKKKTTWTKCTVWGKAAENAAKMLEKGTKVVLAGDVYLDEWTRKEGGKGYTLCCDVRSWAFAESKGSGGGSEDSRSDRNDRDDRSNDRGSDRGNDRGNDRSRDRGGDRSRDRGGDRGRSASRGL